MYFEDLYFDHRFDNETSSRIIQRIIHRKTKKNIYLLDQDFDSIDKNHTEKPQDQVLDKVDI